VVVKSFVILRKPYISARIQAVLATAVATAAAASVVAAPAGAATSPVLSVSVSTSNTSPTGQQLPLVAGTVYAVTYTLTNNLSDPLTDVSFSDHLPAGLTIAPNTSATASHCIAGPDGGPKSLQTQSGATSISESGFTVAPGDGAGCSVEVFVTAGFAAAAASDTPGSASFVVDGKSEESNFASSSAPASTQVEFPEWNVSVISRPKLAITYPRTGAHFAFDQKVRTRLSGAAAAGDSILPGNLYAIDESNTEFTNGQRIATDIPGKHTLTVWASTTDGFIGAGQKITYTVGSPAPVDVVSHRLGSVSFDVKYLATGRATMKLHYGSTVIGYVRKWVHVGKEMPVWIALNAAGERLRASHKHGFEARLSLEYQVWDVRVFKNTPVSVVQNIEVH
jgi:uncharacterized repeat protein (TIGR01451 family)